MAHMELLKTLLLLLGLSIAYAAPPRFDPDQANELVEALKNVKENLRANIQIGPLLTCSDADGDPIRIRIDIGSTYVQISFFGVVSLRNTLDRESPDIQKEENRRKITFICEELGTSDPQQDLIEAFLVINDVNDNAPTFKKINDDAYYTIVPENTAPGTMIYDAITVTDADGSDNNIIEADCVDECDLFEVRSVQTNVGGQYIFKIYTKGSVRGKTAYTMKISAHDVPRTGEKSLNSTETHKVVIAIQDIQDLPPAFALLPLNFYMSENHQILTPLSKNVGAFDQDKGDPNDIEFALFAHPDDPNTFNQEYFYLGPTRTEEIGPDNVTLAPLILNKPVDREMINDTGKILKLRIMAMEKVPADKVNDPNRVGNPMNATETIQITVLDINDEKPTFDRARYEIDFPEREGESAELEKWHQISNNIRITVRDKDGQGYNEFEVSISQGNGDNNFKLNRNTGAGTQDFTISAYGAVLDYEVPSNRERRLVLRAEDKNNPAFTSTAEVIFRLTDMNDNLPKFTQESYTFSLNEGDYGNTLYEVGRIQATDADSGNLGTIVKYQFDTPQDKFIIDDDGIIYATGLIDYDSDSASYAMTVTAFDGGVGANQKRNSVILQIIINNVADVGPRFLQSTYVTFVTEDEVMLRPPIRVQAEDPEGLGTITYRVNNTVPALPGYFAIPNPSNGELVLTQKIDYKQTKTANTSGTIVVKVQACTTGASVQLCADTSVIVTVTDLNNFPPVFRPSNRYTVNISELANPGDLVIRVSTTDADAETDPDGDNAKVRYQIGAGSRDDFQIGPESGEIIVSNNPNLDTDAYDRYELTVIARDRGNPTKSATATVTINILDANNKDPYFTESTYFFNVKDDVAVNTDINRVIANDPDQAHQIEYSLDFSNLFIEVKGEVRTSSEATLTARNALKIDPISGMLKTASLLDRANYEVINFAVKAEDINIDKTKQAVQTATASVILTILGSDDTRPYFIASGWSRAVPFIKLSRPETNEVNWKLYSLYAYDPKNAEPVTRYVEIDGTDQNDYFAVDGRIIRVKQVIDYESLKPPRELTVGIRAFTNDSRSVDAYLVLTIIDVNDNAPRFSRESYEFSVRENANFALSVGSVVATDADSGTYGEIQYSLEGPNSNHFFIVTNRAKNEATLFVGKNVTIDYEEFPRYTLYITATDNPGEDRPSNEQLKSTVVVIVNVIDENDNNPVFEQDVYRLTVVGTKPENEAIDYIRATDRDKGRNGDLTYSLSSETSSNASYYFGVDTRLQGTTTTLKMGRMYVKNSLKSLPDNSIFELIVAATDNGLDYVRRGTTKVIITVSKGVKDPKPKWDPNLVSKVYVPEDKKKGYSIANITAQPANSSSSVSYSFITAGDAGGDFSNFLINSNTGHVTLNGNLDYEAKNSYNLLIRATDNGNASLTNQFLLTVLVVDIDDNKPAFNACRDVEYPIPVPVSVEEGRPEGTYVYTAVACDLDSAEHNKVRYRWYYDDIDEYGDKAYCQQEEMKDFTINGITGDIHTKSVLDREAKDSHLLCILVEPLGRKKRAMSDDLKARKNHDRVLYVLVTVLDTNDEGPEFGEDLLLRVITEYPAYVIDQAVAMDKDLDPNNLIRYTIDSILFTKGGKSYQAPTAFNINSGDGTITIGTNDYSDYVGGYFNITVRAADAKGEINKTDTMTVKVIVGHSSQQIRVVFQQPADSLVEEKAKNLINDLNGLKEAGVYYEIESIGYHIISNADDPVFDKTDVCLVVVKDDRVLSSLDSVKRLSNEEKVKEILTKYGAIEPGPCEPARSVYPVGWESYWWVLVAFAIFIFVITLILIIIVVFLYRSYRNYMDSQRTYLVSGN